MVDPALAGTMVVGGLLLVAVFVAIAQTRVSPLATANAEAAAGGGPGYSIERWQRRLESDGGRALAFLVGGALVVAAAGSTGWGFPVSELGSTGLRGVVALLAGGALALAIVLLVTTDDAATALSIAFLLLLVGVGAVSVLAVAAPAPSSNVWLVLGGLAAGVGALYGVFSLGRSYGPGNAAPVFFVAVALFVLVLIAITVRLALGA